MRGNTPIITTVIPTYRRPQLLRRAITCLLRQTYRNFQVIVYDNASGDETADVVHELAEDDTRVKYFCHGSNIGVLNNFQYAMKHVQTPFFSILSDDDLVMPDFYETALNAFSAYPDAMFAATCVISMDESGNIYPMHELTVCPGYYEPPQGLIAMLKHGHPTWTGILFRNEIVSGLGGLDLMTGAASDLDFELRAATKYPFVTLDKNCAVFSTHDSSLTTSARFGNTWPGWLKMIENVAGSQILDEDTRCFARKELTIRLQHRLITITIGSLVRENFDDARQAIDIIASHFDRRFIAIALRCIMFATINSSIISSCLKNIHIIRRVIRKLFIRQIHIRERFNIM